MKRRQLYPNKDMDLFKITLNWHGENHVFHTYAPSESIAVTNARIQLTTKLKKHCCTPELYHYFNGHKDNVKAEKLT